MIVEERLTTYLHSLESADIPVLDEIEQEALADMVPIIRKETKSFLKVMLEIKRPVKILEIGTAVGFSAILMGKYSPEECRITTIENYEKRIPIARANFARAGMEQKITLLEGDALEIMKYDDRTKWATVAFLSSYPEIVSWKTSAKEHFPLLYI